jgi:hypothetical protein
MHTMHRQPCWQQQEDAGLAQEEPHGCVGELQSWAHRSYKLSERSKAMSDLWFSEWKKMSVERWANCQKKEFAHRSKRSLNIKERAFEAVRSLSDETMLSCGGGAVYNRNTCGLGKSAGAPGSITGKKQNRGAPYLLILQNSGCRSVGVSGLDYYWRLYLGENARNGMNWTVYTVVNGGVGWKIRQNVLTKNRWNFN